MSTKTYLYGQFKRIVKLFPGIFALSVVFALTIGISGYFYAKYTNYNKVFSKYNVGFISDSDSLLASIGLQIFKAIDDSSVIVNIKRYESEEEGFRDLHDNKIKVLAVVPNGFMNDIYNRNQSPHIKIYAASNRGITTVMMDKLVNLLSDDLVLGEAAVYALQNEMSTADFSEEEKTELEKGMVKEYTDTLMARGELTNLNETGLGDGLSFMGFFFCGIVLYYTAMQSFCSISFFIGGRTEFFMIAKSKGVNSASQVLCEFACFFLANMICGIFTLISVFLVFATGLIKISDFADSLFLTFLRFSFFYMIVLLGFTALAFLLFETIRGIINKFLMSFLILTGFSFISGFFYPRTFLPEAANIIGQILPTGVAYNVLAAGISGNPNFLNCAEIIAYTIVFIGLVIAVRKVRIERCIN